MIHFPIIKQFCSGFCSVCLGFTVKHLYSLLSRANHRCNRVIHKQHWIQFFFLLQNHEFVDEQTFQANCMEVSVMNKSGSRTSSVSSSPHGLGSCCSRRHRKKSSFSLPSTNNQELSTIQIRERPVANRYVVSLTSQCFLGCWEIKWMTCVFFDLIIHLQVMSPLPSSINVEICSNSKEQQMNKQLQAQGKKKRSTVQLAYIQYVGCIDINALTCCS